MSSAQCSVILKWMISLAHWLGGHVAIARGCRLMPQNSLVSRIPSQVASTRVPWPCARGHAALLLRLVWQTLTPGYNNYENAF